MNQVMDISEVAVVTLSSFVLALLLTVLLMKLMFKAMQTLRMVDVREIERRRSQGVCPVGDGRKGRRRLCCC